MVLSVPTKKLKVVLSET